MIGATSALALAEQGFNVTLIEQGSELGQGASGSNGGQLSYNYTDAMASPQLLRTLPKLALAMDPSFRMRVPLDWDFMKWGIRFISNCGRNNSDANTLAVLELALQSREVLHQWINQYQFAFKHKAAQKLHLYENKLTFDHAKRMVELKNAHGGNQQWLDFQQTLAIEPSLASMNAKIIGAVHSPDDEVGDVRDFTQQAIQKSIQLGGGELLLNTRCEGVQFEAGRCRSILTNQGIIECDQLVVCGGDSSHSLAAQMGVKCAPTIPVTGYSLDYPENQQTPNVSLTDTASKMVLCKLGDRLRVAGIADVGYSPRNFRQNRIDTLRKTLLSRFPDAGQYKVDPAVWIGARPMTSNSQPVIEKTKYANVYLNYGHGMLGWTLAAGSAARLTNLVLEYK